MAFFKLRSQGNEARPPAAAAVPAESAESLRRRARHRLIGAAVLVLVGVVGFPLLFDTQPRPIPVDIPIEVPDRNKVKPLAVPTAPGAAPAASAAPEAPPAPARGATAPAAGGVITEAADGSEIKPGDKPPAVAAAVPAPKPEPKPEAKPPVPRPEAKPEAKPDPKPEPKPDTRAARPAEPKPPAKPTAAEDSARARALLDGKGNPSATAAKPAAAATAPGGDAGRFVVQVGAFADPDKARETRQKLERAGLKTYTHVARTPDGDRTRVRIGPFASRADADKAAATVKGLALPAAVLTL